jgi:hypothetical protein
VRTEVHLIPHAGEIEPVEPTERVGDEQVALVAAVVAHLLAEQACGDADLDLEVRGAPVDPHCLVCARV